MRRPYVKLQWPEQKAGDRRRAASEKLEPPPLSFPEQLSDQQLFAWAMHDVAPRDFEEPAQPGPAAPEPRRMASPDDQAWEELTSLVRGERPFDRTLCEEYIERVNDPGARPLLRKLRRGQYAIQAQLDLHGMDRDAARQAVERFIAQCLDRRLGCVKIIHGRGHNSKENRAVLKEQLQLWLATRRMSRSVLAYTSARACDGGYGAVYVLLRRPRRRWW